MSKIGVHFLATLKRIFFPHFKSSQFFLFHLVHLKNMYNHRFKHEFIVNFFGSPLEKLIHSFLILLRKKMKLRQRILNNFKESKGILCKIQFMISYFSLIDISMLYL
jgi:hypothetical protein